MKNRIKYLPLVAIPLIFAGCEESPTRIQEQETLSKELLFWQGVDSIAPVSPEENWAYFNNKDGVSYIWDGTQWDTLAVSGIDGVDGVDGIDGIDGVDGVDGIDGLDGISINWQGSLEVAPALPSLNDAYYNSKLGASFIYDGTSWAVLAKDGVNGTDGSDGVNGIDGIPIIWKGALIAAPLSPELNWAYYNTELGGSFIFNGTTWDTLTQDGLTGEKGDKGDTGEKGEKGDSGTNGISIIWKGELATAPENPELNWAYFNTALKTSYIWNGTQWDTLAVSGTNGIDGINGTDGVNGTNGINGISIVWKGELTAAPENPELNWAYYNSTTNSSYIYSDSKWSVLASGVFGPDYEPTIRFITPNGAEVVNGQAITIKATAIDSKIRAIAPAKGFIWSLNGTDFSDTTDNGEITHTFPTYGDYHVWVKAVNDQNVVSDPAGITITVLPKALFCHASESGTSIILEDYSTWFAGEYGYTGMGEYLYETNRFLEGPGGIKEISFDDDNTYFLTTDNVLMGAGANAHGSLGNGTNIDHAFSTEIATDIKTMVTRNDNSLILKNDGTLWAVGRNWNGELGVNSTEIQNVLVQIASDVASMSLGENHAAYVKNDFTLWVSGLNRDGQLGTNSTALDSVFTQVLTDVKEVSLGNSFTLAVKNDGTLWATGDNDDGQLGTGSEDSDSVFVQVASDVKTASAGVNHSMIIKNDNSLWASGYNYYGSFGDSTNISKTSFVKVTENISAVTAGDDFTVIIKNDGTVWGTGDNGYGEIGLGQFSYTSVFKELRPSSKR